MYAKTTAHGLQMQESKQSQFFKILFWSAALFAAAAFMADPAFATGTATGTATGGAAAAQARVNAVALGWQNIVMGIGVAILIIAWSFIGYAIAFGGKTMKDLQNPAIGTTVAGLAPILVGWLFS